MSAPVGNALIGQSGGPTAVINQSLVGVIEECLRSERIKGVYGALHGVKGVLNEDMIDLGRESAAVLEGVANTPCAALRSVRMKPTEEDCARMLEVFEAHDILLMPVGPALAFAHDHSEADAPYWRASQGRRVALDRGPSRPLP